MISIIAAVDKNFLIGKGSRLPWHLPADFEYFKTMTGGQTVVMGSKTYFSLPEKNRPLPGRRNIVLSRSEDLRIFGAELINNIEKLQSRPVNDEEIFVIGGAEIYRLFLEKNLIDRIYLTGIEGEFEGDIYFPKEFLKNFKEISREFKEKDSKNSHNINFIIYERK